MLVPGLEILFELILSIVMSFYRRVLRQDCEICPPVVYLEGQVFPRYHKRFSSRAERMGCQEVYDCPTCVRTHSPRVTAPLSVCVGSGTLHEFWAPFDHGVRYEGSRHHVDYVSLPGATIGEMRTAFMIEYQDLACPMNVVLLPGYNDLLRGAVVSDIMQEIRIFQDLVELQAHRRHPERQNTFGVAAMPYAPRMCKLPGQGDVPSDFQNYYPQQSFLNEQVLEMTASHGLPQLDFSRIGLRWDRNEYGEMMARPDFAKWREANPRRMLHLNDATRIRMARQVGQYFASLLEADMSH